MFLSSVCIFVLVLFLCTSALFSVFMLHVLLSSGGCWVRSQVFLLLHLVMFTWAFKTWFSSTGLWFARLTPPAAQFLTISALLCWISDKSLQSRPFSSRSSSAISPVLMLSDRSFCFLAVGRDEDRFLLETPCQNVEWQDYDAGLSACVSGSECRMWTQQGQWGNRREDFKINVCFPARLSLRIDGK